MIKESQFKRVFRQKMHSWTESLEPSRGSGIGIPDLIVMMGDRLLFVELKVGEISGDKLSFTKIRPSQFSWHDRFTTAGGSCCVVVGVKAGKSGYDSYILPRMTQDEFIEAFNNGWMVLLSKSLLWRYDDCSEDSFNIITHWLKTGHLLSPKK